VAALPSPRWLLPFATVALAAVASASPAVAQDPSGLPPLRPTGPVAIGAVIPPEPAPPERLTLPAYRLTPSPAALRVRMAWRGGAGRVSWTLTIVVFEDGRRTAKIVRGAGPAGPRATDRTFRVPARWRGLGARTRLEVVNGPGAIRRERAVRLG
jgi:hypothetical protein